MAHDMKHRLPRILAAVALAALLLVGALAALVWWGPVPISDKRMLLDFMLGRGIEPPSEETVVRRLAVPHGDGAGHDEFARSRLQPG